MRILTVRQPWAWAIIHRGKDVENRVRNVAGAYRGPVAIHVAKTDDGSALAYGHPAAGLLDFVCPRRHDVTHNTYVCVLCVQSRQARMWGDHGHIIGVVDLVGVHNSTRQEVQHPTCWAPGEQLLDRGIGYCSPWAESGAIHLELANPRALATPVPYRGALGLRELPDAVAARVLEAVTVDA